MTPQGGAHVLHPAADDVHPSAVRHAAEGHRVALTHPPPVVTQLESQAHDAPHSTPPLQAPDAHDTSHAPGPQSTPVPHAFRSQITPQAPARVQSTPLEQALSMQWTAQAPAPHTTRVEQALTPHSTLQLDAVWQ